MGAEVLPKRILIDEGAIALWRLDGIRARVDKEEATEEKKGLPGALENLHFIENNISGVVGDFFVKTKRKMPFGYKTLSLYGEVPITYCVIEQQGQLGYAFDPMKRPTRLTEDLLKRLWNANINQDAVKAFGNLSKIELINAFQSHIVSSIK